MARLNIEDSRYDHEDDGLTHKQATLEIDVGYTLEIECDLWLEDDSPRLHALQVELMNRIHKYLAQNEIDLIKTIRRTYADEMAGIKEKSGT